MNIEAKQAESPVGNTIACLARIHGVDQENVTLASVLSISRTIYRAGTGTILSGPTTIPKVGVIFDTPQLDYGWRADLVGYNMRDIILGTVFTAVGELSIVYTILDASSPAKPSVIAFDYKTTPLF